jgi:dienelactone hydrolase
MSKHGHRSWQAGYAAFVPDLYGESFPFTEAVDRHIELMKKPGLIFRRAKGALEALANQNEVDRSRLGAIGFCQGGITALELARGGLVRCAVGFHPGLGAPEASPDGPMRAKVLMLVGDQDPVVPPGHREEFVKKCRGVVPTGSYISSAGVGHAYTNPAVDRIDRPDFTYSSSADRRSWQMMLDLLQEELRGYGFCGSGLLNS